MRSPNANKSLFSTIPKVGRGTAYVYSVSIGTVCVDVWYTGARGHAGKRRLAQIGAWSEEDLLLFQSFSMTPFLLFATLAARLACAQTSPIYCNTGEDNVVLTT